MDAENRNASRPAGKLANKMLELLCAEPAYRLVLCHVLTLCRTPRLSAQIEDEIRVLPEMKNAIHSPFVLLDWLAQAGGIVPSEIAGRGKGWETTELGNQVAETQAPKHRILALLSNAETAHRDIYMRILSFCVAPRTRTEIEAMLQGDATQGASVTYPSFFVQQLEDFGGLEWTGKWQTTAMAKGVVG